ncbi:unnamed protein product [Sphacelaria rigidula]
MSAVGGADQVQERKNFNTSEKNQVIRHLLAGSKNSVPEHGAFKAAAEKFGCCSEAISRLWKKDDLQHKAGIANPKLTNGRRGKCGQKGINIPELTARLQDIPLNARATQRRLAAALGIVHSTLLDNLKALELRAHSNMLNPFLTNDGML